MKTYLHEGETYRSRLEEVLHEFRTTPSNAVSVRDRARDEASLLISLIHADAAEALVSAELNLLPRARAVFEAPPADLVSVDDAVAAFDRARPGSREEFLRFLALEPFQGDADREGPPYSFRPEVISKLADSLGLEPRADGSTPRLPGEQSPAVDEDPEVDFEEEIDVEADTLDQVGKPKVDDLGLPIVEDDEHLDYDDPDLDDFRPAGKPASKPETPLQKAKKSTAKKETKK